MATDSRMCNKTYKFRFCMGLICDFYFKRLFKLKAFLIVTVRKLFCRNLSEQNEYSGYACSTVAPCHTEVDIRYMFKGTFKTTQSKLFKFINSV